MFNVPARTRRRWNNMIQKPEFAFYVLSVDPLKPCGLDLLMFLVCRNSYSHPCALFRHTGHVFLRERPLKIMCRLLSRSAACSVGPPAGDRVWRQQHRHAAVGQPQSEAADIKHTGARAAEWHTSTDIISEEGFSSLLYANVFHLLEAFEWEL